MDSLNDIWTAWNQQWGATVATIIASIALALNLSEKIQGAVSAVRHWRVWSIIIDLCRAIKRKHRMRLAKKAMYSRLDHNTYITVQIGTYDNSLRQDPNTLVHGQLVNITPDKPRWLNDYFVANALRSLADEGKIVKATLCEAMSLPFRPQDYLFQRHNANKSIQDEANDIEINNKCSIYQSHHDCPMELRYEWKRYAETIDTRTVRHGTQTRLKESAPPCDLCWEKENWERGIKFLVENITKYDLAEIATKQIIGENSEFQEAVIRVCVENRCVADVGTVKEIVRSAIEIRRNQLERVSPALQLDWTKQSTEEFSACLSAYVKKEAG